MVDLITSLSGRILPRLGQDVSLAGGVREWLVRGTYRANLASTSNDITLEDVVSTEFLPYLTYDYQRFALSSWESFSVATLEHRQHGLSGWPLLKLYYSGFFAAHAMMRCMGEGVAKLEKPQADALEMMLNVMNGASPAIKPNMFIFQLTQDLHGRFAVTLKPHPEGGGVHESFWRTFVKFLERISADAVAKGAPDAGMFVAGVRELAQLIIGLSRGVWFSATRNDINYQHKHGVWFPIQNKKNLDRIFDGVRLCASSAVRLDVPSAETPLTAFVAISHILAMLNYEMAEFIAARSPDSHGFGSRWRRFKNQI